ncbi:putative membrane protein YfcA [Kibdelosporangium banguiense]|uniref:Probable membrane transporter protein n=1 Tax=Kibdelosporangium banguiense TaxID=1365924 RepID=A0ABS4U248_9PSEU|nr:sulfite exporter TauE/SafE family protein [Kibdelosporangium banguiense]MBP2330734.1 putative membrane protein YfcA [Kibdelosporangium banguiense]
MAVDLLLVAAVGLVAGAINGIAGAGALLTFPVFLALGLTPLQANVCNSIGVVPGNIGASISFRRELRAQKPLLRKVIPVAAVGSLIGGALLFVLPERVFTYLVPGLLGLGAVLVLLQPLIARKLKSAQAHRGPLRSSIFGTAIYGGYFGTGVGVIFFALLGLFAKGTTHEMNAVKAVLQALANGVAGILFCFVAPVHWPVTVVFGITTAIAGPIGAYLSRRIPPAPLRYVIGTLGLAAAVKLAV